MRTNDDYRDYHLVLEYKFTGPTMGTREGKARDNGILIHAHGPDGREEFHILPTAEHGHLHCQRCGVTWEIDADEGREMVRSLERRRGFAVDLSHVTIVGLCAGCRAAEVMS